MRTHVLAKAELERTGVVNDAPLEDEDVDGGNMEGGAVQIEEAVNSA